MHPQLQALADEFHFATARLHALVGAVPAERWPVRRDPVRWSVAECVAHLNLTGAAYEGILSEAFSRFPQAASPFTGRYRRDLLGWLLWRTMPPPLKRRYQTVAQFIPESTAPVPQLVADFERLQAMQLGFLAAADGLPLTKVKVTSPFSAKVRYNLYSCFSILPAHQHRHLWQAEQVWT